MHAGGSDIRAIVATIAAAAVLFATSPAATAGVPAELTARGGARHYLFTLPRAVTVDFDAAAISVRRGSHGIWIERIGGPERVAGGAIAVAGLGPGGGVARYPLVLPAQAELPAGRYRVTTFGTEPATVRVPLVGTRVAPRLTPWSTGRRVWLRAGSVSPSAPVSTSLRATTPVNARPHAAFFAMRIAPQGPVGHDELRICVMPRKASCGDDASYAWGAQATRVVSGGAETVALSAPPGAAVPSPFDVEFAFTGADAVASLAHVTAVIL